MSGGTKSRAGARGRLTPKGWVGRGGGATVYVQPQATWRGSSVQTCGLWPYAVGTAAPSIGVPIGRHMVTGATVCADPLSWFQRARLINQPSVFLLGLPGLGKSSLVKRMILGLAGYGVLPVVLGDIKPDYVALIEAMDGQVIRVGRGRGYLNILDPGEATHAAARLTGDARAEVLADAHGRRQTMVCALIQILRAAPPTDHEEMLLGRALEVLDERYHGVPILADLIGVLEEAPEAVRFVAMDGGDRARYDAIVRNLVITLKGLLGRGRVGEIFSQRTTTPMRRDSPVVFDVSSIPASETDLRGAALMASWATGFGSMNIAHALADAGLEPQRHFFVVQDEMWMSLRTGGGMVDRADGLTRLNRTEGCATAMISHTMSDLEALVEPSDVMKARGFAERAGMVICGGLPRAEMPKLNGVVAFSQAEQDMLASWQTPPGWNSNGGPAAAPPGQGNFLVKVGGRPGIPVHVHLTPRELELGDTNQLWHTASRIQRVNDDVPSEVAG